MDGYHSSVMDSIIQSVGNRSIVVIVLPDDQTIPTSEKGFSEMTDYDALGRYTEASSKLSSLLYERNEVIMQLQKLTSVAIGMSISAGVVLVFNVVKAQELIGKISKLEEEINSTISEINTNATKCGKSTIRTSVQ